LDTAVLDALADSKLSIIFRGSGCSVENRSNLKQVRCQFHQHFTRDFFNDILAPKNCKAKRN